MSSESKPELDISLVTAGESAIYASLPPKYTFKQLLGRGATSSVILAYDTVLERDVAIKIIRFGETSNSQVEKRFIQECRTLAILNQENLVTMMNYGSLPDNSAYIVMEYLEGKTLSTFIGNGKKLPMKRFYPIFLQALSGLDYAHSNGVVHRDLKPSNIMISESEGQLRVKLLDFGISCFADETLNAAHTRTGVVIGSPDHMSPEQCRNSEVTALSDIYSVASVMYEALTGETPFQGNSAMDVMYKKLNYSANRLEDQAQTQYSSRLARIIDKCLSSEPAQRIQSALQMKQALTSLNEMNQDSRKVFGAQKVQSQKKNRFPITVVVVASILVPAIVLSTFYLQHSKRKPLNVDNTIAVNKINRLQHELKEAIAKVKYVKDKDMQTRLLGKMLTQLDVLKDECIKDEIYQPALSAIKDVEAVIPTETAPFYQWVHVQACKLSLMDIRIAQKKYDEAIKLSKTIEFDRRIVLQQDIDKIRIFGSKSSAQSPRVIPAYTIKSKLFFRLTQVYLFQSNYTKAEDAFSAMFEACLKNREEREKKDIGTSHLIDKGNSIISDQAKEYTWKIFRLYNSQSEPDTEIKRLAALNFLLRMSSLCISNQNADLSNVILDKGTELLAQLTSANDKSKYSEAIRQARRLSAE